MIFLYLAQRQASPAAAGRQVHAFVRSSGGIRNSMHSAAK
jgi:hypothetical protein